MVVEKLKVWPEFYEAIAHGFKTFEIRKDDRGFVAGTVLHLQEYEPSKEINGQKFDGFYTGNSLFVDVLYVFDGGSMGVESGYCVMAIKLRQKGV
jgi:hypothetical protein